MSDLRDRPEGSLPAVDVCIIGSGPAGASIASALAHHSISVCVVESGGVSLEPESAELDLVESVGMPRAPQPEVRARQLGGTSSLWSGRCGAFDPIDYAPRPWVPNSGWPIDESEVEVHLDRAGLLLGLAPSRYRGPSVREVVGEGWCWRSEVFEPLVFQASSTPVGAGEAVRESAAPGVVGAEQIGNLQHGGVPRPVHFGDVLRDVAKTARNVEVLTHSTVVEVRLGSTGDVVAGVVLATPEGRRHELRARVVVLAAGGIENARLLLASRETTPHGVGNDRGLVGRYLMDHPLAPFAVEAADDHRGLRRMLGHRWIDSGGRRHVFTLGLRLSAALQREERLLNGQIHLIDRGDGASPLRRAFNAASAVRAQGVSSGTLAGLAAATRRPDQLASNLYDRQVKRRPTLPSGGSVVFGCVVEQVPDPMSRVTLSDEADRLGVPRARIDWRADDREFHTFERMVDLFYADARRIGLSLPERARWTRGGVTAWRDTIHDMAHPLGTTRMAADPQHGVVDADCQVHGVSGLYVAGSSVFPTSGYVNPTLTIVALALRLADHLRGRLAATSSVSDRAAQAVVSQPTSESEPEGVPGRVRVGVVGLGARVRAAHLDPLLALDDEFDVVGFSSRSPDRRMMLVEQTGLVGYASAQELAADSGAELLIVAVHPSAVDTAVPPLLELGVPLLLETPISWSLENGRKLVRRIRDVGATVGIAEQTPFLPMHQLTQRLIDVGHIGRVTAVHNDFAIFDYHGFALLRRYLGSDRYPRTVTAIDVGEPGASARVGTVTFDDGALLLHQFAGVRSKDGAGSPGVVRVTGSSGSTVGSLALIGDGTELVRPLPMEREVVDGRLQAVRLRDEGVDVAWRNPFCHLGLDDDQIAVATLLRGMWRTVRYGADPPYRPEDALLDIELLTAMRYSASAGGRSIQLPVGRADQVRGVDLRAVFGRLGGRLVGPFRGKDSR